MRLLIGMSPSGGIAAAHLSGPVSAADVAMYKVDDDGNIFDLGIGVIYNVDPNNAVPASVPCALGTSNGGNYYVTSAPGFRPSVNLLEDRYKLAGRF